MPTLVHKEFSREVLCLVTVAPKCRKAGAGPDGEAAN
jgi:hypothetical protein